MKFHRFFLHTIFTLSIYFSNLQLSNAVIGGEEVVPGEYPFMVYVSLCGGSLITEDMVLTVASCLRDPNDPPANGPVWLGRHGTLNGTQFSIVALDIDPITDLAIVQISPAADTNMYPPVILDGGNRFNHINEITDVIGWGFEFFEEGTNLEGYSYELLEINVPIIADETCEPMVGQTLEDYEQCAGESGKDCCSGDEGGPMFRALNSPIQHGVISWHPGVCGDPFGVYINLADAVDWINTATNDEAVWNVCSNEDEMPVLLDLPFSHMINEVITLVIALPRDTFKFEAFFDRPKPSIHSHGLCDLDSEDVTGSTCWTRIYAEDIGAEGTYPDSCWWLFSVEVAFNDLWARNLLLVDRTDDGGRAFFSHMTIITTTPQSDALATSRGIEVPDLLVTSSHKFQITFPARVEVSGDIRVYDDVTLYSAFLYQTTWDTDWAWGFRDAMRHLYATVGLSTTVQWPFKFSNPDMASDLMFSESTFSMTEDCVDPGIQEVGDSAYNANINLITGLPDACLQLWHIDIYPNSLYDGMGDYVCSLDGAYHIRYDVECQEAYADHCPLDDRFHSGIAQLEFELTSENWCEYLDWTFTVTPEISVHSDPSRSIESEQYDFIVDFIDQDGQLRPAELYFQVRLHSNDTTIMGLQLKDIFVTSVDGKEWQFLEDGVDTAPADINFGVMDNFDPDDAYLPADEYSTSIFEFQLPYHIFPVRRRDSQTIMIWVIMDVWISDLDRNDIPRPAMYRNPILLEKDDSVRKVRKEIKMIQLLDTVDTFVNPQTKVEVGLRGSGQNGGGFDVNLPDVRIPDEIPQENQDDVLENTAPEPALKNSSNRVWVLLSLVSVALISILTL